MLFTEVPQSALETHNYFGSIICKSLDFRNLYTLYLPKQTGTLALKGGVAVLTGVVNDGGTLPLPNGFTENQCKFFVSMNNDSPNGTPWDINEIGAQGHYRFRCYLNGRIVVAKTYKNHQGEGVLEDSGIANYLVIGVK